MNVIPRERESVSFKVMSWLALFLVANGYRAIKASTVANVSGHGFVGHFFFH